MKKSIKEFAFYLGLIILGSALGGITHGFFLKHYNSQNQAVPVSINSPLFVENDSTKDNPRFNFIAKAVQMVGPSVVRIDSAREISENLLNPFGKPFFDDFFKDGETPKPQFQAGTGSGLILSEDGQILTNAHVVEGAQTVTVTLNNGNTFAGKVMGIDQMTDIAVVKIEAKNLPIPPFANTQDLIPGEWVVAIGNPMGLDHTVTVGIISALDRTSSEVGVPDKRVKFIQTDAAINPGNSGGPLLNALGQVIGINTAIRPNAQGLGFAIPIQTAQNIAQQILTKGKAQHPYLGIHMINLSKNWQENLELQETLKQLKLNNLKIKEGILVVKVVKTSPAQKAGFKVGDLILKVGDQIVKTSTDVQQQVELSKIGEKLEVQIIRGQKNLTLKVRPAPFPN